MAFALAEYWSLASTSSMSKAQHLGKYTLIMSHQRRMDMQALRTTILLNMP